MRYVFWVLLGVAFLGSSCVPASQQQMMDDTNQEMVSLMGDNVVYDESNPSAIGYFAKADKENAPGLILIHEWWGLNDQIRKMADDFAAEGYNALAIDLYSGRVATTPDDARAYATEVRENLDPAFSNIEAAIEWLKQQPEVDMEKLASVGWCFGGQWSYEIAKNNMGVDGSIMYYGRFAPEDDLEMMTTLIQGHFGEEDQSIPVDDVRAFRAKLNDLGNGHEIFIYPNAEHAFANEESDAYNPEAAEEAWQRTMQFLSELFEA